MSFNDEDYFDEKVSLHTVSSTGSKNSKSVSLTVLPEWRQAALRVLARLRRTLLHRVGGEDEPGGKEHLIESRSNIERSLWQVYKNILKKELFKPRVQKKVYVHSLKGKQLFLFL